MGKKKKYRKGWQCPVCKAVMNPKQNVCINCSGMVPSYPIMFPEIPETNSMIITLYSCPVAQKDIKYKGRIKNFKEK